MEAGSIRLKKDSVKTYIKIQFAGPRQYFWFRFKIFKKRLRHKVHYWSKIDQKYIIFCTYFSSQNAGNRILGHWNFRNFIGTHAPRPLYKKGSKPLFDTVGYFFQTYWLLQFLLKPLGRWAVSQKPILIRVKDKNNGSKHFKRCK